MVTANQNDCPNCRNERWVCETHPNQPWGDGGGHHQDACYCGAAGMPCKACNTSNQPEWPPGTTEQTLADQFDLLAAVITSAPPATQEAACDLTVKQNIATFGPALDDGEIALRAVPLAKGLFGKAYRDANRDQQLSWISMIMKSFDRCQHKD